MVRVDIALVPGVLREVRIHVIVHWELSPSRGCQRLADPSSQHAQLRVAPPESCQPWARPNRLNELLERRTNLHVVRGQGHGVVPSANLVFERGLVRGPDLALQGVPVQPREPFPVTAVNRCFSSIPLCLSKCPIKQPRMFASRAWKAKSLPYHGVALRDLPKVNPHDQNLHKSQYPTFTERRWCMQARLYKTSTYKASWLPMDIVKDFEGL
mmetsp:Transcript_88111/g.282743  ORF Transcript_88111/g.282743 Transcript_88111/m.282743 type:complete len:212 (+) Transcript_88111:325-960(+)